MKWMESEEETENSNLEKRVKLADKLAMVFFACSSSIDSTFFLSSFLHSAFYTFWAVLRFKFNSLHTTTRSFLNEKLQLIFSTLWLHHAELNDPWNWKNLLSFQRIFTYFISPSHNTDINYHVNLMKFLHRLL